MRLSFFKLPKAKPFEYKPLYYNEEKEKIKERENSPKYENADIDEIRKRLKSEMNEKWAIGRNKTNQARGFINQRYLLIYIAVALLLLYFIFK
jgi:hypothetical protein